MSVVYTMGPWPCPICGMLVYSHQVHQCRLPLPWRTEPTWSPPGWVPTTRPGTTTTITITPKPKPPGEAMRPEDV